MRRRKGITREREEFCILEVGLAGFVYYWSFPDEQVQI
jgi:hypothetical protein